MNWLTRLEMKLVKVSKQIGVPLVIKTDKCSCGKTLYFIRDARSTSGGIFLPHAGIDAETNLQEFVSYFGFEFMSYALKKEALAPNVFSIVDVYWLRNKPFFDITKAQLKGLPNLHNFEKIVD